MCVDSSSGGQEGWEKKQWENKMEKGTVYWLREVKALYIYIM